MRTLRIFHPLVLATTLALGCWGVPTSAQETKLPDIGSSAGELLTPARQAEYGAMMLRELRSYGYVLDDPLLDDWLNTVGNRLGANSDLPRQSFTFFMLRDRQINAFATLGGYIAMNAGLVLTAEKEDEVAAVLSHEIAHVTQQHVLRGAERAQRDQIPILLGMLAAIVAAQATSSTSSGDATQAAIVSAMGLMEQRQINYTRSNESEADRIGIHTLSRSGYDIDAMAGFFQKMAAASRGNQAGYEAPEFLRTHPVNVTRISEAQSRAEQIRQQKGFSTTTTKPRDFGGNTTTASVGNPSSYKASSDNPLLPLSLQLPLSSLARGGTGQFEWVQERLRVLSANTTEEAIREYEGLAKKNPQGLTDAQKYGLALLKMRGTHVGEALNVLTELSERHSDNLWVSLALAQAEAYKGLYAASNQRFDHLLQQRPNSRSIALTYAETLNYQNNQEAGKRAQQVLRPLLGKAADDPVFQATFARASELAGDTIRASEAYAETAFLNGRAEQALMQLNKLKTRDDLDYVARARIDARITSITPTVLELRKQGMRDPDIEKR